MVSNLSDSFDKSKKLIGEAMANMDGMLTRASGSYLPWVCLFTIIILALIYKLQ